MDKKLTVREAALILGVSSATVLNWRKAGILSALTEGSVADFLTNRKNRLTSRANKRHSSRSFSPSEYGKGKVSLVLNLIGEQNWSVGEALFYAVEDLTGLYGQKPSNSHFKREMEQWRKELFPRRSRRPDRPSYPPSITTVEDFPGWLYQTLQREGEKSVKGSYYTPSDLAEDILDRVLVRIDSKTTFFDPCCGTGGFLIPASRRLNDPERIYGQDSDPLAVRLARINLMRQFPFREFAPSIHRGDSLNRLHRSLSRKKFTAIATNPPWGYRFAPEQKKALAARYPLTSGESASLFLLAALENLSQEGRMGMLLPESLLHRSRHRDIRTILLNRTAEIRWYGQRFSRVQSECFSLILTGKEEPNVPVRISGMPGEYSRDKISLTSTPLLAWNIFTAPEEGKIFDKLFAREHILLGEGSRWGLGIVTGNNRERLNEEKKGRPILRGRDISPFTMTEPTLFLEDYHDSRLQQKAPLELYEEAKIVYRFIARYPVAAWDRTGSLTLNSVNFLIPGERIDPELAVLFLNSRLFGIYFEKTFHTLKVLRGQLEILPLPLLDREETDALKELIPRLRENDPRAVLLLNERIYDIFGLTKKEREYLDRL
ncbi:MAG: N-6 DNA methylase [Spirochaetales bacterium]|nr:N-6 DNA methylase [Spirochaetales bacterium]